MAYQCPYCPMQFNTYDSYAEHNTECRMNAMAEKEKRRHINDKLS